MKVLKVLNVFRRDAAGVREVLKVSRVLHVLKVC